MLSKHSIFTKCQTYVGRILDLNPAIKVQTTRSSSATWPGRVRMSCSGWSSRSQEVGDPSGAVRACGFTLHAGVAIAPHQRGKLERLCRYVSRPQGDCERLALTLTGQVRYTLKTLYRDGTTHVVVEPLDFIARLAALVPPPRRVALDWARRFKRACCELDGKE